MNILISTQNFPPSAGGIQNYVYELALALHHRGAVVEVLCDAPKHEGQIAFDENLPIKVERVSGIKWFRRRKKAKRVEQWLKQPGQDKVLLCDSWKSLELINDSGLENCIVACLAHGMEFPAQPSPKRLERISAALQKADLVLANSSFTAERVKPFSPPKNSLQILLPGVSLPEPASTQDRDWAQNLTAEKSPVLITVGRLEQRKGQDKIIEIMPRVLQDYPDAVYLVAGSGPTEEALKEQVENLDLGKSVIFCGRVNDSQKSALLERSDLFLMPCRAVGDSVEGFGLVYLEAAMFGKASLAGRVGGAVDAVLDGETGLLCDGDNPIDVERVLRKMLSDPDACRELGQRAKVRAEQQFLWRNVAENILNLINRVK
ncbi:glycosyltransferase family 4 protein [Spongiibacter sp. KMU-158]|uniref:Glycosyltransferase family 4 protein n=1 Tax=Spongiibacter pelagi TaxID=2760804 RepID=A0A927C172_9GAMM|nr:glycosyltransferase family 4 protein [Spongiibacter pelagi]MBD2859378.1 glycosyltransferase family 4 protein [Spongiibacter pelagi]